MAEGVNEVWNRRNRKNKMRRLEKEKKCKIGLKQVIITELGVGELKKKIAFLILFTKSFNSLICTII